MLALIIAFTLQQVKTKCRSGVTQAQGYLPHVVYVWPVNSVDPYYLAPKYLLKVRIPDFACALVFAEFRFYLGHPYRPFARSGHMVRNKISWDADNAVGLSKQRNSYQFSRTFLCFESPTALLPRTTYHVTGPCREPIVCVCACVAGKNQSLRWGST